MRAKVKPASSAARAFATRSLGVCSSLDRAYPNSVMVGVSSAVRAGADRASVATPDIRAAVACRVAVSRVTVAPVACNVLLVTPVAPATVQGAPSGHGAQVH